jgi:hypothetical protein
MLYVNSDRTIQLTRGDTAHFNLTIRNNVSQTDYEIQPDDTLTMFMVQKPEQLIYKKIPEKNCINFMAGVVELRFLMTV